MANQPTLYVKSSDGIISEIDQGTICKFSKTIETMVMDLASGHQDVAAQGDQQESTPIQLNFTKRTLDLIMAWADHHKSDDPTKAVNLDDIPRPERAEHMTDWNKIFTEGLSQADLSALLVATDYWDIEELADLLVQRVLLLTRSKTIEEIRVMFGIVDDLTPQQKEQIELENAWLQPPTPDQ